MKRVALLSAVLFCRLLSTSSTAGDLRIYTRVFDKTKETTEPVAKTLTLFHADRVYDFIESLEEVLIFEPSRDRFIVLNTKLRIKAIVTTKHVRRLMASARKITRDRIEKLRKRGDATSTATAEMLAFQLKPALKTSYDRKNERLTLSSPHLRYDAALMVVTKRETAESYRNYADWIVQLNFVLYPRVVLPAARMALNKELAGKQAIPLEVELTLNTRPRVSVRAEHRIHRSLDGKDRSQIAEWDSLLKDKSVRTVTLQDYQQQLGLRPASK